MNLEVSISQTTADWLERKAEAAGAEEAEIAARVLEDAARRELAQNGEPSRPTGPDRLREFDRWTRSLPGRGGRADINTNSLYD